MTRRVTLCGIATCVAAFMILPVWSQPRQPPPPGSVESMSREIRLGKDRGFSAWLTPVEITDQRFNPFVVQVRLTAEGSLGLNRVRFVTDLGQFESAIAPQDLPKLAGPAFGNTQRPSANATMTLKRVEDRSFNIETLHAGWLARTENLKVTVYGPLREREFTVSKKGLARMQEWLAPRVAKYE